MVRNIVTDGASRYTRITKIQASKRIAAGQSVYIIAHKMRPGMPFSLGMMLHPDQDRTFAMQVKNFECYNADCHETGTYAAFYVVTDLA